jgi:putative ABC transport system permease protein
MSGFLQDLRYALRQLRKSPGFTAAAVITLAFAVGITTAVFSVIDAMVIRPLPYDHPGRIVALDTFSPQGYYQSASYPEYRDWRHENHTFSALAAYNPGGSANFDGPSGPLAVPWIEGTDNFFQVFGVAPYLGRTYASGEDQPGKNDVAVLSYDLWQQYFGSQANVLGEKIKLDGVPYAVIGVMPAGFRYPINARGAIYTPLHMPKGIAEARGSHWFPTIGRLKEGVSRKQAQADMNRVFDDLGRAFPATKGRRAKLTGIEESIVGDSGAALTVLLFSVLAVLAIGCVNLAGLLLARGVKREREIALRSAVGAGRLRIVRQMLSELFLLVCLGAVGGTVITYLLLEALRKLLIAALARGAEVHLNTTALLVAISLSILTSLVAGVSPALRLSAIAPNVALKTGGSAGSSRSQHRLRSTFIVVQMGLALVLLVTAGLLLRVLAGLRSTELGFNPDHVLESQISLSPASYKNREINANFYGPLLEEVQAIPGVKAAGLIDMLPIQESGRNSDMHVVGHPPDPANRERLAETRLVSPGYFKALGIPLIRGRLLSNLDTPDSGPDFSIVVNEAFVKKFFAEGEDPIGKYVEGWFGKLLIVGVVGSVRQDIYHPPLAEVDGSIYQIPLQYQIDAISNMSLLVSTSVEPQSLIPSLRHVFLQLDPGLPFRQPLTMRQVVADVLVLERLENWLFGTFAALAVLLAIVGLYGLISHEVELSAHNIGVRMALGATRGAVLTSIYRRVGLMLLGGIVGGLAVTEAVQKVLSAIVVIHAKDAGIIAALSSFLFAVGIASVLPAAWRAAKVDPMVALRYE